MHSGFRNGRSVAAMSSSPSGCSYPAARTPPLQFSHAAETDGHALSPGRPRLLCLRQTEAGRAPGHDSGGPGPVAWWLKSLAAGIRITPSCRRAHRQDAYATEAETGGERDRKEQG